MDSDPRGSGLLLLRRDLVAGAHNESVPAPMAVALQRDTLVTVCNGGAGNDSVHLVEGMRSEGGRLQLYTRQPGGDTRLVFYYDREHLQWTIDLDKCSGGHKLVRGSVINLPGHARALLAVPTVRSVAPPVSSVPVKASVYSVDARSPTGALEVATEPEVDPDDGGGWVGPDFEQK